MRHMLSMRVFLFWIAVCIAATASLDFRLTPNPVSRALPIVSLLHEGRHEITTFHEMTIDTARIGMRYFSDKAPGSTWWVLPWMYPWRAIRGPSRGPDHTLQRAMIAGVVSCGVLPFVVLVGIFWWPHRNGGLAIQLAYGLFPLLGSFIWVYAGEFYGHLLAAVFCLAAWISARHHNTLWVAGIAMGLAFITEYPTVLGAVFVL